VTGKRTFLWRQAFSGWFFYWNWL